MHMVIRTIVEEENKKRALEKAERVFNKLIERQRFDYFVMFDKEYSSVAGKARWGDITPVARVNSKEGQKLIKKGLETYKRDFLKNLGIIRQALDLYTDEEILEGKILRDEFKIAEKLSNSDLPSLSLMRYRLREIGAEEGPSVWLYDQNGYGITTSDQLERVINRGEQSKTWVIPADVHF